MTDDIVARLREFAPITVDERREAADEIERLRADCAKLETAHGQNMREIDRLQRDLNLAVLTEGEYVRTIEADSEAIRAECDALRELLREAREVAVGAGDNAFAARIDAALGDPSEKTKDH